MLSMYPAIFYKEEDGKYSVVFPDLNHLATCGDDLEDAMNMAVDCMAGYLHWCREEGEELPKATPLQSIDPAAYVKEAFPDLSVQEGFVNMVTVDLEAYVKEYFEKSVRKTLTIPAWLNTAALKKGINFSQTLQEALLAKIRA